MKLLVARWVSRDSFTADLQSAVRSLLRARGFATAAMLTFALGVTINVAVFSAVDRLMFRPLPYADPAQLVQLHQMLITESGDTPTSSGILSEVSLAIAERTNSFSGVAWAEGFPVRTSVVDGESPLILSVATSNILDVLGVRPILGRGFVPDDAVATTRSVVLPYETWQRQFGGSKDVLTARWGTGAGDHSELQHPRLACWIDSNEAPVSRAPRADRNDEA
jgi:putative ABC transport system permease protein